MAVAPRGLRQSFSSGPLAPEGEERRSHPTLKTVDNVPHEMERALYGSGFKDAGKYFPGGPTEAQTAASSEIGRWINSYGKAVSDPQRILGTRC